MTYFAFLLWLKGYDIYSNYHLEFPYSPIKTLENFNNVKDGVLLCDDFENWVSSKFRSANEKKDVLNASLQFGKRNINYFIWSCKRPLEIDKTLRQTIDYFVECNMELKYMPSKKYDIDFLEKYLDNYRSRLNVYSAVDLKPVQEVLVDDLNLWCELYDTKQEIKKPQ